MKIKLMFTLLLMSSGLCAMEDEAQSPHFLANAINLLNAMRYAHEKKQNEIVICHLRLSLSEGHISPTTRALDEQMNLILEHSVVKAKGTECWTFNSRSEIDDFKRTQCIVYGILPSVEKYHVHIDFMQTCKRYKKPFVIAVREDGEDVVKWNLKEAFPNDTLVIFQKNG